MEARGLGPTPVHAFPGGRRRPSVLLVFPVIGSFLPPMLRRPGPLITQAGSQDAIKMILQQMKGEDGEDNQELGRRACWEEGAQGEE